MTRVKKGVNALKRRRNILKQVKGYRFGRSTKERAAKDAILHAGRSAFGDRRKKKRNFRKLFTVRINAEARINGISYSKLIGALKKSKIDLNRKVLSEIAEMNPESFKRILTKTAK
ncbi:MAG: 50S ribosomal protein L20 [Candidatus Vogelbacteria bacterium]|nr:50S ribosomal protein L20 [Candidatus Vogelbacteria bacterium]